MSTESTLLQSEEDLNRSQIVSRQARPELAGYELERILGSGSFGQVWMALQKSTGQRVAIKFFLAGAGPSLSYIRREMERLRDVSDHPGVVGLIDADLEHATPYFVMPLLSRSLEQQLEKPDPARASDWLRQLALALRHSHEKGLLHCDLKPSNVMVDDAGLLRLVDFGQSCQQGDGVVAWGTLGYMAPEQARLGSEEALSSPNVRWDVYGLGATLYRLLTGRYAYWNDADLKVLSELPLAERLRRYREGIEQATLAPVLGVDRDLADLIAGCLRSDPQKRIPSMEAVLQDLDRRAAGQPLLCRQPWSWGYRLQKLARRPTVVVTALASLVLLSGGLYSYSSLNESYRAQTQAMADLIEQRAGFAQQSGRFEEADLWWAAALRNRPYDASLRARLGHPRFALRDLSDDHSAWFSAIPGKAALILYGGQGAEIWDQGQHRLIQGSQPGDLVLPHGDGQRMALLGNGRVLVSSGAQWPLTGEVASAVWNAQDELVIASDNKLTRWTAEGKKLAEFPLPDHEMVELSPDGQWARMWANDEARLMQVSDGASAPIPCDQAHGQESWFSPGSKWLLGGTTEQAVLFSLTGKSPWKPSPGAFCGFVGDDSVALRQGNRLCIEGALDKSLDHEAAPRTAVASLDRRYLLSWSADDRLCLWDLQRERMLTSKPLVHKYGATFGFSGDGRQFFGCAADQKRVWSLDPWRAQWSALPEAQLDTLAWGPEKKWLLAANIDEWHCLDAAGKVLSEGLWGESMRSCALSSRGDVALATTSGLRRLRGLPARPEDEKLASGAVESLAYSGDGAFLAAAFEDRVQVWSTQGGPPQTLAVKEPLAVGLSVDGSQLGVIADQEFQVYARVDMRLIEQIKMDFEGAPHEVLFLGQLPFARSGSNLWCAGNRLQLKDGYDPDRPMVVSSGEVLVALPQAVQRYSLPQLRPLGAPLPQPGGVVAMQWDEQRELYLLTAAEGTTRLWDADGIAPLQDEPDMDGVTACLFAVGGMVVTPSRGVHYYALPSAVGTPDEVEKRWQQATGFRLEDLRLLRPLSAPEPLRK